MLKLRRPLLSEPKLQNCNIHNVGLARNGNARFWCRTHGANATGTGGIRLDVCEAHDRIVLHSKVIDIDPSDYPGGVALWGAVAPVFDTTTNPEFSGVHLHARRGPNDPKSIDDTFDAVTVRYKRDLLDSGSALIDADAAKAFYLSTFVGNEIECLFCTYCGNPHTDSDTFAINRHRRHLCHSCGRFFQADHKGISNPIALLRGRDEEWNRITDPLPSTLEIDLKQILYPGGIQIWASNPALLWLSDRPEESGLHVHAYDEVGARVVDDTYGIVSIDGIPIPVEQAAYLMAQQATPSLVGKIASLACGTCGISAFDTGKYAFEPRAERPCEACGASVAAATGKRPIVSNPLVRIFQSLKQAR
jgi:hypothetical protein